jgi:hypothetical protein
VTVTNRGIEFHDMRVERIERTDRSITLWLSAFMHESEGRPGRDRGTGWNLPARFVVESGEFDRPFSSSSLWVTEGRIAVDNRLFDNFIPLPLDAPGKIRLILSGAEGDLVISGVRAYVEPTGPAVYVEEFPGFEGT